MFKYMKFLVVLLFVPTSAMAYDLQLMSLDRFAVEGYQIVDNRNEYTNYSNSPSSTNEYWTNGIAADFDIDAIKYGQYSLYYRARVFGDSTNEQFRYIGLQYEGGFEIKDYLNVWVRHESDHALDTGEPERFPLQNYIGATITLYKRDRGGHN